MTGECCGRGRDQLAYNLEYTRLFALETMAMQQLAIGPTTIVASSNQDYLVKWPLDRESRQRRIETGPGTFFPRYAVTEFILKWLPEKFYSVYYPNYDNAGDEQLMAPFYKRESWIVVEQGGYGLAVVTMVRRAQDDHAWR